MIKKIALIIICLISSKSTFALCANCKVVAEQNQDGWANGLNTGILFLMIPPYIILMIIILFGFKGKIRNGIKNFVNS